MTTQDRLNAFGDQLIHVHSWLRAELARLRENVDLHLEGRAERPRDLRVHCLAFCSVLERHHTGEDAAAFPALAGQFPELRPVLMELSRDHEQIGEILRRLQDLLDGLGTEDAVRPRDVRAELDGLAALMESHFTYEERKIVAALNTIGWDGTTPDFLLTGNT